MHIIAEYIIFIWKEEVTKMISINKVHVNGFANIVDLNLELSNITALLATNCYGKSNALVAIHFGIDYITQSAKIKKNMLAYKKAIPQNKNNRLMNFSFSLSMDVTTTNSVYNVEYGYTLEWGRKDKTGKVIEEHLDVIKDSSSQKATCYFKREEDSVLYRTSETGRTDKKMSVENYELAINKLASFDNLFYKELISEINKLDFYLDRSFDSEQPYAMSPFVMKGDTERLSFNDDSLPHTLHILKKNHPSKFNLIMNAMIDLFPFIENLTLKEIKLSDKTKQDLRLEEDMPFEVANSIFVLMVQTNYFPEPVRFTMMSDGVKRVLLLLTRMCIADLSGIPVIGIEEPENSIHPGLLRHYIQILSAFLENTKVIISSHSPFIVNNIPLSDVYVGMPSNDGLARFCKITPSGGDRINKYAIESGMDSGQFIFSMLAGTDDYDLEMLTKSVSK